MHPLASGREIFPRFGLKWRDFCNNAMGIDAEASPFCVLPEGMNEMKETKRIWEKSRTELFRDLDC